MIGDEREKTSWPKAVESRFVWSSCRSDGTVGGILAWPRVLVASQAYLERAGVPLEHCGFCPAAIIMGRKLRTLVFRKGPMLRLASKVEGKLRSVRLRRPSQRPVKDWHRHVTPLGACRREETRGELIGLLRNGTREP